MKNTFAIISLSLFLGATGIAVLSFFMPVPLHAQVQISASIPGQYATTATSSPSAFVANFYQYALSVAGILAFGIIVYGGVKYMASVGNPSGQSDAKEWIKAAIMGILLLAGSYMILYIINPGLVNLSLPNSLESVGQQASQTGFAGSSGTPTGKCTPPTNGPCTAASLSQYSCLGNSTLAGGVCNVESSGNAAAGGDLSTNPGPNGRNLPASVGLFQINLSANTIPANCKPGSSGCLNCPAAFTNPYTGSNPHTSIKDMNLYKQCVAAAETVSTNVQEACQLSKNGTNWSLWGPATRKACGI